MKISILTLFLMLSIFVYAEEKIYLSMERLSFTEKGIFLKKENCTLQLPGIGYDVHGYYLAANPKNGVTVVRCAACGFNSWWTEKHCCLREDCVYYCY